MYKLLIFVSSIFILSSSACKQSKEASTKTSDPAISAQATQIPDTFPKKSRLVISFFSIASGVDDKAIIRFEDSIGEYAGALGINIDYEKTHWGREGETDFCLELRELNSEQQLDFVSKTRELLKTAEHVKIYENEPCRHRRPR